MMTQEGANAQSIQEGVGLLASAFLGNTLIATMLEEDAVAQPSENDIDIKEDNEAHSGSKRGTNMLQEDASTRSSQKHGATKASEKADRETEDKDKDKATATQKKSKNNQKKSTSSGCAKFLSATSSSTVSSSTTSDRTILPAPKPRFGFDECRNELKCRNHGCGKLTNCYDDSTVICPNCGIESVLRYCSLRCLLDPDMRFHWAQECGQCPLPRDAFRIDESTLIARPSRTRPYIQCPARDNPARHRQAVFHSSNMHGDYFVFNDFSLISPGDCGQFGVVGAGDVIAKVAILPDFGFYEGQSVFHEVLEACLRIGFQRPDRCLALLDMVTIHLVSTHQWNQEVQDCLIFQMKNEFNYDVPQEMLLRYSVPGTATA